MVEKMVPSDVFPGVIELLKKLRTMAIKVGVASSSRDARLVIEKLGIATLLDTIVDGSECQHPKPAPDLFLLCAVSLEVPPQRCLVVEDAQAGIDAAKAAGMRVVGVGTPEQLSGCNVLIAETGDFSLYML
jgi:HAD superfamily hydrolase (TIGR01509 family)